MRNVESRDVEDTNAQFEGSIEDLTLWDINLFTLEEEFWSFGPTATSWE